jgi:hypothetical protein
MGHPTSIRGRDRAHGPDPDRGLGRDHVRGLGLDRARGLDLVYGPTDDHAQLDRGPRPNNPQRIALVRGVVLPNRLLRMAAESSSRRAICNAVPLDTNTLPPIRTLVLAARAECKPSEAEAVRQSKYQPKPVHALLMRRLKSLPQSVWFSGNCACLRTSLVLPVTLPRGMVLRGL